MDSVPVCFDVELSRAWYCFVRATVIDVSEYTAVVQLLCTQ